MKDHSSKEEPIEEGNTTSNNLIANFNEYESEIGMPHNQLPRMKISRNAKILYRTKEAPSGIDLSYKIDPKFNLPEGEAILEENLEVKDYDSDENSP